MNLRQCIDMWFSVGFCWGVGIYEVLLEEGGGGADQGICDGYLGVMDV